MFNLEQTSFCVFMCGLDKSSKCVKKICLKMTANNSSIPEPADNTQYKKHKTKRTYQKTKGGHTKRKVLKSYKNKCVKDNTGRIHF